MGGPIAVGWLSVGAFCAIACYCLSRVAVGVDKPSCRDDATGHVFGRDVDLAHVAMGFGMAAMFSPVGDPLPKVAWAAVFAVATGWFAARMLLDWPNLRELPTTGRAWHWHHVIEPLAMIYMVLAPSHMAMSDGVPNPLTSAISIGLLGYFALFAVWSAVQVPRVAAVAVGGSAGAGVVLSPRLVVSCHTAIAVGMAYGFALMM